jgi:hypothetical protein
MQILSKDSMEMLCQKFCLFNLLNVNFKTFGRCEGRVAQTTVEDEGANESRLSCPSA